MVRIPGCDTRLQRAMALCPRGGVSAWSNVWHTLCCPLGHRVAPERRRVSRVGRVRAARVRRAERKKHTLARDPTRWRLLAPCSLPAAPARQAPGVRRPRRRSEQHAAAAGTQPRRLMQMGAKTGANGCGGLGHTLLGCARHGDAGTNNPRRGAREPHGTPRGRLETVASALSRVGCSMAKEAPRRNIHDRTPKRNPKHAGKTQAVWAICLQIAERGPPYENQSPAAGFIHGSAAVQPRTKGDLHGPTAMVSARRRMASTRSSTGFHPATR
jgi:hypothetical protein